MGDPGFSVIGAVFLVALLVPNVVLVRLGLPDGLDPGTESRALRCVERIGQLLTVVALVGFSDTGLRAWSPRSWWLVAAAALMLLSLVGWGRYVRSDRTLHDLYRPLLGVPVPLATLPVLACLLLGLYGRLVPLIAGAVLLGIGHVGVHALHAGRATSRSPSVGEAAEDVAVRRPSGGRSRPS